MPVTTQPVAPPGHAPQVRACRNARAPDAETNRLTRLRVNSWLAATSAVTGDSKTRNHALGSEPLKVAQR